ncbi:hypothetical protein SAMN05444159_4769 [Bradyrhizobium lablabi]|uniref:DNA gyrase inhibitor YacG n=1 Tax=Bradyrhizobium lablabi TaxID=722472 RepID=A0A1M6X5K3_9BRAD|nr:DNA gyrase inhibitor YacG [Bradyrhizobium lablabi]SHL01203.1 hypothetical protein SAMN05444159_4769 [Bradyrhizobium lablabi]
MPAKPPKGAGPGKAAAKGAAKGAARRSAKKCPICGKPANEVSKPFCSERCRDVDLNRWLSGSYSIPSREDEDDDGE